MKKYYLKNGKEVKMGDKVVCKTTEESEFGNTFIKRCFLVTEESLLHLIKAGIIICKENKKTHDNVMSIVLNKISKFLDCSMEDTIVFLSTMYQMNEAAFRSMLYKKIAVEFDKAYPDYIADAKEVWVINLAYDVIDVLPVSKSMNFKNFAAFRTEDNAKKAVVMVDEFIKYLNESDC